MATATPARPPPEIRLGAIFNSTFFLLSSVAEFGSPEVTDGVTAAGPVMAVSPSGVENGEVVGAEDTGRTVEDTSRAATEENILRRFA